MTSQQSPGRRVYSVTEFASGMARWLARKPFFSDVAIRGEVSSVREFGGHLGFTLKERQAILECVAWSDRRKGMPELKNGMAVIAAGSVGIRADRGCYQLVVETLEPAGLGDLFLLYERLKEKFRLEGLFEPHRKRAVPELPRRIALISARGEAMADFTQTLLRDAAFLAVEFIETRVQGEGAEIEIAAALDEASRRDVDVIVLTRGGGSYEDLFPFNLEPVVRAIVRSRHAVVTAIGHTQDHHLADCVADLDFHTPSLAAKYISQGWVLARRRLLEADRALGRLTRSVVLAAARRADDASGRLQRTWSALASGKKSALVVWEKRLARSSPRQALAHRRERFVRLSGHVETVRERVFVAFSRTVERAGSRLDALSPIAPLSRGYAIVTKDGAAIRDVAVLRKGDCIDARFERGSARALVETVTPDA